MMGIVNHYSLILHKQDRPKFRKKLHVLLVHMLDRIRINICIMRSLLYKY